MTLTSVFQTFDSGTNSGLDQEGFWKHCLACGMAASLLERKITKDREMAEVAMLAGTLNDLGKMVLAQYMPERYAEVVSMARARRMMLCDEEEEMLGTTHAAVGRLPGGMVEPAQQDIPGPELSPRTTRERRRHAPDGVRSPG